jgi:hypothetical protein
MLAPNVVKLYDDIFYYFINNQNENNKYTYDVNLNYFGYNKLWELYINNNDRLKNIKNMNYVITFLEKDMLNNLSSHRISSSVKQNMNTISNYYNKIVMNKLNNLNRMPQYYNKDENMELTKIMDIMIHCIKFTLCGNLYLTIVKLLTKYLISLNPGRDDDFISTNIESVLKSNPTLIRFLLTECPEVLVKINMNIYESEYDEDKEIDSTIKALQPILDIVLQITTIQITKESEMYKNLDTVVLPFYADVITKTIQKMKTTIDNYNRYLAIKSKYLNMLSILL